MSVTAESLEFPDNTLLVSELDGTPRSGKGSIAASFEKNYSGVRVEETGSHYRAFTAQLYEDGLIDPEMETDKITEVANTFSVEELAEMGASKSEIVGQFTEKHLYGKEISKMVPGIGSTASVRTVVKGAFKQRVSEAAEDGTSKLLILDGRKLAPIIEGISGLTIVLRTFVWCMPMEAAYRQAAMLGIEPGTEEFLRIHDDINERFHKDQSRTNDPVKADDDAIDYWHDKQVNEFTAERQGHLLRNPDFARRLSTPEGHAFASNVRFGAGTLAVRHGKQIKFDTTQFREMSDDPKNHMLQAAHVMFEEAVQEYSRLTV